VPLTAEQQDLAATHIRLVKAIVYRLPKHVLCRYGVDELEGVGYLYLCRAAEKWPNNYRSFRLWAWIVINNGLKDFLRKRLEKHLPDNASETLIECPQPDLSAFWAELWKFHCQLPTGIKSDALAARIEGRPIAPIARQYGVDVETVRRTVKSLFPALRIRLEDIV
jgi:DNA-directed RNA polymerase specialized sigma24 family protein